MIIVERIEIVVRVGVGDQRQGGRTNEPDEECLALDVYSPRDCKIAPSDLKSLSYSHNVQPNL